MVKLILTAGEIPDDTEVTKVTGQKIYRLKKELVIHGVKPVTLKGEGVSYLVSDSSITSIPDNTPLLVEMEDEEAVEFLEDRNVEDK